MRGALALLFGLAFALAGVLLSFNAPFEVLVGKAQTLGNRLVERLVSPTQSYLAVYWIGAAFLVFGVYLLARGVRAIGINILETLNPGLTGAKMDAYVRRRQLAQGPKIVAIGGGTGLSTLLRGLKHYSSNITAIVTVTDDGGSSGRLAKDKGMIPPGDIRNCLVALADAEKAMTDLFQHRFRNDSGSLSGHSMGNLLIAALVDQAGGDFDRAVEIASDVLTIRGQVVPSTLAHTGLRATFDDGTIVSGETAIADARKRIRRIELTQVDAQAHGPALEAIAEADLICLGPGSVYTSVVPPLLVGGISAALAASDALKIYVCNVMTQPGESDAMTASEHVGAILDHVDGRAIDAVLVNTGVPSETALARYREVGQILVEADIDRIRARGVRVIPGNLVSETDVVRHDPAKVAARLVREIGL
ncbi:YvcK family protein [bacterium]|nr:MAG: YvcK family protein [bacterium]